MPTSPILAQVLPPPEPQLPYSGPYVSIIAISGNQNSLDSQRFYERYGNDPRYNEDSHTPIALEELLAQGHIVYSVYLTNPDGSVYIAPADITVVIKVAPENTTGYSATGNDSDQDFHFSPLSLGPNASYDPATGNLTVIIPAGQSHFDFTVDIMRDKITEVNRSIFDDTGEVIGSIPDEAFRFDIISTTRDDNGEIRKHPQDNWTDTVIDEDPGGVQVELVDTVHGPQFNILEGADAKFTLRLSQAADEDIIVVLRPIPTGQSSSATLEDFDGTTLKVVIPAGQTSLDIDVGMFKDILGEGTEFFRLAIATVQGGEAVINPNFSYVDGSIKDDGNGPVVGITGTTTIQESAGDATYTITLSDPSGHPGNGKPAEAVFITLQLDAPGNGATITGPNADVIWSNLRISDSAITISSIDAANGQVVLRVPPNWSGGSFTLKAKVVDDKLTENSENYEVRIASVTGSEAKVDSACSKVVTTITDDSAAGPNNSLLDGPTLKLTGTQYISESGGNAKYKVELLENGNPFTATQDITITLTYTAVPGDATYDGATPREDFEIRTQTVTIPAGSSSATFEVRIEDDIISENLEQYEVQITSATGNEVRIPTAPGASKVVTTIVDDSQAWTFGSDDGFAIINPGGSHNPNSSADGPVVGIVGSSGVRENAEQMTYQLVMDKAPAQDTTVTLTIEPGSSSEFTLRDLFGPPISNGPPPAYDFTGFETMNNGSITNIRYINPSNPEQGIRFDYTFAAGTTSKAFFVPAYNDDLTEVNSTYVVSIDKVSGSEAQIGALSSITTTIADDASGPQVNIYAYDADSDQWGSAASLEGNQDISQGFDSSGFIHFKLVPDNQNPNTDPSYPEEPITVTLRLTSDGSPITARGLYGAKGDGSVNPAIQVTDNGDGTYTITMPANTPEVFLALPKVPDGTDWETELVVATILNTDMGESVIGQDNLCYVDLFQSGSTPAPVIAITPRSNTVTEGGKAVFDVDFSGMPGSSLDADSNGQLDQLVTITLQLVNKDGVVFPGNTGADLGTIQWSLDGGITTDPVTVNPDGSISFAIPVGTDYSDIVLIVPALADTLVEGDEHYALMITGATGANTDHTQHTITIEDATPLPVLTLSQNSETVFEGGDHTYVLYIDKAYTGPFAVTFDYTDGTATKGEDYLPVPLRLEFLNGTAGLGWVSDGSGFKLPFTVPIPDDEISENPESFTVTLSGVEGAVKLDIPSNITVTTTINDDGNDGPTVYFASSSSTYAENDTSFSIDVILSRPALDDVEVTVQINNGTAVFGQDFFLQNSNPSAPGYAPGYHTSGGNHFVTFTVPAGSIQQTYTVDGVWINDTLTEGTENLSLSISQVSGAEASIGGPSTHNITLNDVFNGPAVSVSADNTTIYEDSLEGPNSVVFTFSIPTAASQDIVVTFQLQQVGGAPAFDGGYALNTDYSVTIPAGTTSVTWPTSGLIITNDKKEESSEAFKIVVGNVSDGESVIGDGTETITVVDDDSAPTALPDNVIIMVNPCPDGSTQYRANLDVMVNDYDMDGDPLTTVIGGAIAKYGTVTLDASGNFEYTVDTSNTAIAGMIDNEKLDDNSLTYTLSDGANTSTGTVDVSIRTGPQGGPMEGSDKDEYIFGTKLDDWIDGGGGKDTIRAGEGNDTIHNCNDLLAKLYGGGGNDLFIAEPGSGKLFSQGLCLMDGGAGVDTLTFTGSGILVDMVTDFTHPNYNWGTRVQDIEVVDISGGNANAANAIVMDQNTVEAMNQSLSGSEPLRILGDGNDTFAFADSGWVNQGVAGDTDYIEYKNGLGPNHVVWVHKDMVQYGGTVTPFSTPLGGQMGRIASFDAWEQDAVQAPQADAAPKGLLALDLLVGALESCDALLDTLLPPPTAQTRAGDDSIGHAPQPNNQTTQHHIYAPAAEPGSTEPDSAEMAMLQTLLATT